jgi:hypothetical protein
VHVNALNHEARWKRAVHDMTRHWSGAPPAKES